MPENIDDRYLRLLKPVQDQLLKNWEYSISLNLDDYVEHVNTEGVRPNFPEAALILQNSVSFYSRRVDVVHKMIQELVDEVCGNNDEGPGGVQNSKDAAKSKKRKNLKMVESDNLEIIDFVFSDKQVNGNVDKLTFVGVQPTIDIGLVSTLKKKGTSVNAYESDGKYLGFKEEFRVFGICYFDGTVNEEFKNLNVQNEIDPLRDIPNTLDDLNDSMDRDDYDPIEPHEPSEFPSLEPSSLQIPQITANPLSPPTLSAAHSMVKEPQKKARKVEWDTIPSDCQIRCYRLGVENKYDFPVELQDSVELKSFKKKKKRKMIDEEKIEVEDHIRVMWLDRAIRVGSLDALEVRLIAENSLRNTLITSVKAFCVVEEELHDHIESDNDDNDFENFEYDDNDQPAPFTRIDEIVDNDAGSNYAEEAFNAIERLKAKRREDICRGTEVAKRVAEWHESIAPVLEASEAQSQFNVHEYGTRILVKFPDDDHQTWRPFSTIIGGMNKNEICRHFLSTLMLANTYNVEIRKSVDRPLVKDCVELRLISKVRHHEEMDEAMRAN